MIWQGMSVNEGGKFALLGTTVAPSFDNDDFELGDREQLIRRYPQYEDLIMRLT